MPYSSNSGKAFTDRAIIRIAKQLDTTFFRRNRILDLGAGAGTYVERYGKTWLSRDKFKWDAVEIWQPYVDKFNLRALYDNVRVEDVREFGDSLKWSSSGTDFWDICFIGDLAEHMTKEEAIKLVEEVSDRCSLVIIAIPIVHYPQDEWEGNPYEKHVKDDWSHKEVMESFPDIFDYGKDGEIGVYFVSQKPGLLKQALRPQVGVYAICKDEKKFLDRWYSTVQDADFISICDTGSTDGTWESLQEKVAARVVNFGHEEELKVKPESATDGEMTVTKIHVSPWRFDDARNCALTLLPEEIDLCVSIDIDEILEPNWKAPLHALIQLELQEHGRLITDRFNHRFETIWNWDKCEPAQLSSHWHERIHTRKGFQWKLPVHEILVKGDGSATNVGWLPDWKMVQLPDTSKPRGSYKTMLESSVIEDPRIWKSWSFLAGERSAHGEADSALEAIKKAKELPDSDKAYLGYQAATMLEFAGRGDEAVGELLGTVFLAPHVREYKYYLAQVLDRQGKFKEANAFAEMAAAVTKPTDGYQYNADAWGDKFFAFCEQLQDKANAK